MHESAKNFLTPEYFNYVFGGTRPISNQGETYILYQVTDTSGNVTTVRYDIHNIARAPKEVQELGRGLFQQ